MTVENGDKGLLLQPPSHFHMEGEGIPSQGKEKRHRAKFLFWENNAMTWPNLDPLTFAISPSSSRFKLFSVEKHDASGVLQTEFFPLIICFLCLSHFILLDVNECAASSSSCSSNALCTNNVGSYSCSCKAGFTGNGKSCIGVYII